MTPVVVRARCQKEEPPAPPLQHVDLNAKRPAKVVAVPDARTCAVECCGRRLALDGVLAAVSPSVSGCFVVGGFVEPISS
jgi:hypothetical protein